MGIEIRIFGENAEQTLQELRRFAAPLMTAVAVLPATVAKEFGSDEIRVPAATEPERPLGDAQPTTEANAPAEAEAPKTRRGRRKTSAPLEAEPYMTFDPSGEPDQPCETPDLWAKRLVEIIAECATDEDVVNLANANGGDVLTRLTAEKADAAIAEVGEAVKAKRATFAKAVESVTPKEGEAAKEPLDYIRDAIKGIFAIYASKNRGPEGEAVARLLLAEFGAKKASDLRDKLTPETIKTFVKWAGAVCEKVPAEADAPAFIIALKGSPA